ncbi:MAG: hypothetical protein LAO55_04015 [Acidobacteriia bacterium]|nr:hypothetical protein [Terriglobia bacterium]
MAQRKNPHAVALGRLGAKARNEALTPEEREEIARRGGLARYQKLSKDELSKIGKKAGKIGGRARAQSLTRERRKEIGRKAAAARWAKQKDD